MIIKLDLNHQERILENINKAGDRHNYVELRSKKLKYWQVRKWYKRQKYEFILSFCHGSCSNKW